MFYALIRSSLMYILIFVCSTQPDGVFSTAVEEETLARAKAKAEARQQHVVKDDWVQLRSDGASMQEIVDSQADEQ